MKYLKKELQQGTEPDKIAYISFTNTAAQVAKKRVNNDKIYASTMHSMGTRECGINTKTQLLNGDKWKNFKNFSPYCRDMSFESRLNINGHVEHQNPHMRIIELARNKKLSIEEAAMELSLHYTTDIWLRTFREDNQGSYGIKFREAFPLIVGAINLGWSQNNEYARLSVTFAYRKWEQLPAATTAPGT